MIDLKENDILVFETNQGGRHTSDISKIAMRYGAKYGLAEGYMGRTYGIPTMDKYNKNRLSTDRIKQYVYTFIDFATSHPELTFFVSTTDDVIIHKIKNINNVKQIGEDIC